MKKEKILKLTACSILSLALMATPVFANEAAAPDSETLPPFAENESSAINMFITGTVSSITKNEDQVSLKIDNDAMGTVFHVQAGAFVLDRKTGELQTIDEIKEGSDVSAVVSKLAPMALSAPPQNSSAIGFIINADDAFADLSVYNESLVNEENTLKLNLSEKTVIVHEKGQEKIFTEDDLKNQELIVFYTASTRSIPAQTTPHFIMILETESDADSSSTDPGTESETGNETIVRELQKPDEIALRAAAEAKGYIVTWTSAKDPIILKKDGVTISIQTGSTSYEINSDGESQTLQMQVPPRLDNGLTKVPQSFLDTL